MAYVKKIWKDYPDTTTPIKAEDLNNIENGLAGVLDWIYPVGTIYETTSSDLDTTTKMANHFGGTWEEYGSGRVLVAQSAETEFNTLGKTGGSKQLQKHRHFVEDAGYIGGSSPDKVMFQGEMVQVDNYIKTSETGTGESGNLQPYIVIKRWHRIG